MEPLARVPTGVFASAVLITISIIGAQALVSPYNGPSETTNNYTGNPYTVNGSTCSIPNDYLSFISVVHLLPLVTKSSQFLNAARGLPFVFGNAENITRRTQQIGNQPPVHLPDAVEMVFYTFGPSTYCGENQTFTNRAQSVIDVQVPVQDGRFNLTGATYATRP